MKYNGRVSIIIYANLKVIKLIEINKSYDIIIKNKSYNVIVIEQRDIIVVNSNIVLLKVTK
jgi:hypothetical protein